VARLSRHVHVLNPFLIVCFAFVLSDAFGALAFSDRQKSTAASKKAWRAPHRF